MTFDLFSQEMIEKSLEWVVKFISPALVSVMPYIIEKINSAIAVGLVVLIGVLLIKYFGHVLDFSKSEIKKFVNWFRSAIHFVFALLDMKR